MTNETTLMGAPLARRPGLLAHLADALVARFRRTRNWGDLQSGLRNYLVVVNLPTAEPLVRIGAAPAAAHWLERVSPGDVDAHVIPQGRAQVIPQAVVLMFLVDPTWLG
jgi:hypothetical protein